MSMPRAYNLLLVHADDHRPILEHGLTDAVASDMPSPTALDLPAPFWSDEESDIATARWGVIASQGYTGDRLLNIIEPLIKLRQEQQGQAARIYRVPPDMSLEQAARWKKQVFGQDEHRTRYQLILGDLNQVSLALQQVQATDGFVGRLAFDNEEDYGLYAEKVLRWTSRPHRVTQANCLFYPIRDGSIPTSVGYQSLIRPGLEVVRQGKERGEFPAAEVLEQGSWHTPSADDLMSHVAGVPPTVLFTLGPGEGAPELGWSSFEAQRRRQGALSFGREGALGAEHIARRSFLPGGVWLMFSSFSAGTPQPSAYLPWLTRLQQQPELRTLLQPVMASLPKAGERPFIAALPQMALANNYGPLAVIGQTDLAWSYAFQDLDSGPRNRAAQIMGIHQALLQGQPVGVAFRALTNFYNRIDQVVSRLFAQDGAPRANLQQRGHLWMLRQDLGSYVLLGDPAVRLPLTRLGMQTTAPRRPQTTNITPPSAAPVATTPEATARAADVPEATAFLAPEMEPEQDTDLDILATLPPTVQPPTPAPTEPGPVAPTPAPVATTPIRKLPARGRQRTDLPPYMITLEEAVGRILLEQGTYDGMAYEYGVDIGELMDLVNAYIDAGRRAVSGPDPSSEPEAPAPSEPPPKKKRGWLF